MAMHKRLAATDNAARLGKSSKNDDMKPPHGNDKQLPGRAEVSCRRF
jgi:hypothetical protein